SGEQCFDVVGPFQNASRCHPPEPDAHSHVDQTMRRKQAGLAMNEERYHELLGRLLDDELDSTQGRELADWLPQNPDRRSDVQQHLMLWDLFSQQYQVERTADAFVEACKTRIVAEADENIFVRDTERKLREAAGKTARTEGRPALSVREWLRRLLAFPRWAVGIAAVLLVGLGVWLFPPSR